MQQPVCAALQGDADLAETYLQQLLHALQPQGALLRTGRLIAFLHTIARLRWLQGRHEELKTTYAWMSSALPDSIWSSDEILCREIGALVHLAEGRSAAAITDLQVAADDQTRLMVAPILGDPRLHLAHALLQANQPDRALAVASPALAAIRREGAPGRLRWQGPMIMIPILQLFVDAGNQREFAIASLARLREPPSLIPAVV